MDGDDRFADVTERVKAGIAEGQAELVFTSCVERAMAFVAGGIVWTLMLFAGVNFGMNFQLDHKLPR